MDVDVWVNKKQREEFFEELRALIQKYPNIGDHMKREYAEDPTDSAWDITGYVSFDPSAPTVLQGVVLLISHTNLDGFEDLQVLEPFDQSHYFTSGMLTRADSMYGLDGII